MRAISGLFYVPQQRGGELHKEFVRIECGALTPAQTGTAEI